MSAIAELEGAQPPRPPTIRDVARLAGVSTGTVSRVLNDHPRVAPQTRTRVWTAVQQLRFVPNEQARRLSATARRRG